MPPLHEDADGAVRVAGTRVTLETVIGAYLDGATAEEIAEACDAVGLADVHAFLSYYLRHWEAANRYLERCHAEEEAVRAENQKRFPSRATRDHLRSRLPGRD